MMTTFLRSSHIISLYFSTSEELSREVNVWVIHLNQLNAIKVFMVVVISLNKEWAYCMVKSRDKDCTGFLEMIKCDYKNVVWIFELYFFK